MINLSSYGMKLLLGNVVGIEDNHLWYIKLFVNDIIPNYYTTTEDLIEPNFLGYRKFQLVDWKVIETDLNVEAKCHPVSWRFFDCESEIDIFGYFIVDRFDKVVIAERFKYAMHVKSEDTIQITPMLSLL